MKEEDSLEERLAGVLLVEGVGLATGHIGDIVCTSAVATLVATAMVH